MEAVDSNSIFQFGEGIENMILSEKLKGGASCE